MDGPDGRPGAIASNPKRESQDDFSESSNSARPAPLYGGLSESPGDISLETGMPRAWAPPVARGRTQPALPSVFAFLVGSSAPQNVPSFGLRGLVFRAAHFGQLQAFVPVDVQWSAKVAVIELASV